MASKGIIKPSEEKIQFQSDDIIYRCDGFVGFKNTGEHKDILFDTLIVRFTPIESHTDITKLNTKIESFDYFYNENYVDIEVDPSLLHLFVRDSFWLNGEKHLQADIDVSYFNLSNDIESKAVDISSEFTHDIVETGNHFKVPAFNLNGFPEDKVDIYIPTIEIIRYFFSTSPHLIRSVLNGDFNVENYPSVVYEYPPEQKNNTVKVHLIRKFADIDAYIIANILVNKELEKSVRMIYSSLYHSHITNNTLHSPDMNLSFIDKENLSLQGYHTQNKYKKNSFIVKNIVSLGIKNFCNNIHLETVSSFEPNGLEKWLRLLIKKVIMFYRKKRRYARNRKPSAKYKRLQINTNVETLISRSWIENAKLTKIKLLSENKEHTTVTKEERSNVERLVLSTLPERNSLNKGDVVIPANIEDTKKKLPEIKLQERLKSSVLAIKAFTLKNNTEIVYFPNCFFDASTNFGGVHKLNNDDNAWCDIGGRERNVLFFKLTTGAIEYYLLEIEPKNKNTTFLFLFTSNCIDAEDFLTELSKYKEGSMKNCLEKCGKKVNTEIANIQSVKHGKNFSKNLSNKLHEIFKIPLASKD